MPRFSKCSIESGPPRWAQTSSRANILEPLPARPGSLEQLANGWLEHIAEPIQARLTSDERNEVFDDHGTSLIEARHVNVFEIKRCG